MDTENTGQDSHKRCYEQSGKSSDISVADAKRHKNAEKQRRYMENLKTPEKKTELQLYKQKRAARQREL